MGPAMNAAALVVAWLLGAHFFDLMLLGEGPMLLIDFAAANGFILILSLLPFKTTTASGQRHKTDGHLLLTVPFMSADDLAAQRIGSFALEAEARWQAGELDEARRAAEEGLQLAPESFVLHNVVGLVDLAAGDYPAALRAFETAAAHAEHPALAALMSSNRAWAAVLIGGEQLEDADRLSAEAIDKLPWAGPVQSTRGLVLAATGRPDEALELLQKGLLAEEDSGRRAVVMMSMAYAYTLLGKAADAEALLQAIESSGERAFEIETIWAKIEDARTQSAP